MPERILVVDDERASCEFICSILTPAGYQCKTAADGLEALAMLDSGGEFELLISNLVMPNLDGAALLERTKERFPDMPVVIETGTSDPDARLALLRNGAYDYIQKPFQPEHLLIVVRRALEYARLKVEVRRLVREKSQFEANLESLVATRTEQLIKAMADLERSYDNTLETLGAALDLKDRETEGHSKRVTAFSIAIARAMALPQEQIMVIARGAFLHDIGKLAIPDPILLKPGPLTEEERTIMREHCEHGYRMLQTVLFLRDASEIARSHHERYDGTGYPRGLKGNEIPLGARIVAVAEALDTLMSDLPYRAAQSLQAARKELERCSGTQFDPEVVRNLHRMPDSIFEDLRKQVESGK